MHGAIMELLSSNCDPHVTIIRTSYPEPALQTPGARGRKREIDFAMLNRASLGLEMAIEAKWAGSGYATQDNILRDLARLALIHSAYPGASCLFFVAGRARDMDKLATGSLFVPNITRDSQQLLNFAYAPHRNTCWLTSGRKVTLLSAQQRVDLANNLPSVPKKVTSNQYMPVHLDPPDWKVLVWRIQS